MITACSTNAPTGNLTGKPGNNQAPASNNSFKVKAVGKGITENTVTSEITYSGTWAQTSDAGASAGSVHSTTGITDNGDPNNVTNPIKYIGDKWTWVSDVSASMDKYASNTGIANKIQQDNPLITYTDLPSILKWSPNTIPAVYNYNSSSSKLFSPPGSTILTNPFTSGTGVKFSGTGWLYKPVTTSLPFSSQQISGSTWSLEYNFIGTNTTLKAFKGPNRGRISVKVYDAVNVLERSVTIDLYRTIVAAENVINITGLKIGNHKIVITPAGKNTLSTGDKFDFISGSTFGSAEYLFKGDRIAYTARTDSKGGKVNIFLDDNSLLNTPQGTPSLYSLTPATVVIQAFSGMSKSPHRFTIEATGTKVAASSASYAYLDNFEVNPTIKGSFSGTSAGFHFKTDSSSTIADIYIDGTLNKTTDLYSASPGFLSESVTGLSSGNHTFEIVGNYQANPLSSGHTLGFDDISAGSIGSASMNFVGTGIEYIATKGSDKGKAEVFIDGVSKGIVDLYSATTVNQSVLYSNSSLPSGSHKIDIVPLSSGTENPLSSNNLVNIDAFNVLDVSNQAGFVSTLAGTGTSGFSGDNGPAVSAKLYNPSGLAFDNSGNLYISESSNHRIRKLNLATNIITTFAGTGVFGLSGDGGPATSAKLYFPSDVVFNNGNLFVSDGANGRIRKIDLNTNIITTVAGSTATSGSVAGFSGDGGPATSAQLYQPHKIAFDTAGNMFISDGNNQRIRKVNTSGTISTFAGTGAQGSTGDGGPATSATFYSLDGMAFDSSGNLYVADTGNYRIRKIDTSGTITNFAGMGTFGNTGDGGPATAAKLYVPHSLYIDAQNNVYTSVITGVRKIASGTGIITTFAGVSNSTTFGYSGDGGPATQAVFNNISFITFDSTGNLYIADTNNHRVRVVYK
jgi:sugar lactone lactonase YvrE